MTAWLLSALLTLAHAGDAMSLSALRLVPVGTEPTLTVTANSDGEVDVRGACSGRSFSAHRRLAAGEQLVVGLGKLPEGRYDCEATVGLTDPTGGYGQMAVPFEVRVLPPLDLEVREGEIDVEAHTLTLRANRALSHVDIVVLGPGGGQVGRASTGVPGQTVTDVQWAQDPDTEAVKLLVTGRDADGFTRQLELIPWRYLIPHEEVVFETDEDVIRASEVPKLEHAWDQVETVLAKYGPVVEVQLFVAGYTDTVASASYNQALSDRRARSIASWFRQRGFSGPIWYQGFGESALAVPTADGVDEPANRRALYILAAHPPGISHDLPRTAWQKL